ncbi:hypothetical protein SynMVIR181_02245 [Synechococcus sp. MVIR-18-1]|nr:hypothetical protein SynMVIR181_02245 [Synechococcus sp. MVIR-18-1]
MVHDLGADASFLMLASLVDNSILKNAVSCVSSCHSFGL